MVKKILVALTSHSKLGDTGNPTGWYLPELAHPAKAFDAAGAECTVVSPAGGKAPCDPGSIKNFEGDADCQAFLKNAAWTSKVDNTGKLGDLDAGKAAAEYDALVFPGGHGPCWDLASDEQSHALVRAFAEAGKVVGAICHGPVALANVKLSSGEFLVKGKKVTGFSDAEEDAVSLSKVVPFLLESRLVENGATYSKAAELWGAHVVADGKLVTGQNPNSGHAFGDKIIELL